MTDLAVQWIQNQINSSGNANHQLWLLDENHLGLLEINQLQKSILVITNRWDLFKEAQQKKYQASYSDFDLTTIADQSLDQIFYRVSKEKPLVHHLINQAWRCLKINGELFISGYKQEGIKTYIEKAAGLFGDSIKAAKSGQIYTANVIKVKHFQDEDLLSDQAYSQLRPLITIGSNHYFSKPGLFGWNKIDQGSQLLIEHLSALGFDKKSPQNCLDLGCGYGYLTLAAAQHPCCQSIVHWTLTDNNAAALKAAEYNLLVAKLNGRVIADDAGVSINENFDLILCNPPFHQGFQADSDLTEKFLRQARRLIAADGQAFFVVNQFVPLESKAHTYFSTISMAHQQAGFKLFLMKP